MWIIGGFVFSCDHVYNGTWDIKEIHLLLNSESRGSIIVLKDLIFSLCRDRLLQWYNPVRGVYSAMSYSTGAINVLHPVKFTYLTWTVKFFLCPGRTQWKKNAPWVWSLNVQDEFGLLSECLRYLLKFPQIPGYLLKGIKVALNKFI